MNTQIVETDLSALAFQINELDRHFKKNAMKFAHACGTMLLEAKKLVAHGEFQSWVECNCDFGYRQASKYMRIAKSWDELSKMNSNSLLTLNIDEALFLLAKPTQIEIHEACLAIPWMDESELS